jgi:hypothetical protein
MVVVVGGMCAIKPSNLHIERPGPITANITCILLLYYNFISI